MQCLARSSPGGGGAADGTYRYIEFKIESILDVCVTDLKGFPFGNIIHIHCHVGDITHMHLFPVGDYLILSPFGCLRHRFKGFSIW